MPPNPFMAGKNTLADRASRVLRQPHEMYDLEILVGVESGPDGLVLHRHNNIPMGNAILLSFGMSLTLLGRWRIGSKSSQDREWPRTPSGIPHGVIVVDALIMKRLGKNVGCPKTGVVVG